MRIASQTLAPPARSRPRKSAPPAKVPIPLRVAHLLDGPARADLTSRFWYVNVDEFQDTNNVQYDIVNALASSHDNLCVVGDADQSIYAFRGARPSVLGTFESDHRGANVVILEQNYRSTANICTVARTVIADNEATHRSPIVPTRDTGAPVLVYSATTEKDEATRIAQQILDRGRPWSDHAVLVRTATLTRAVEDALRHNGIGYDVVGGLRFYDRAEVKSAIAWVRAATNPADALAYARALTSPRRGIGEVTIDKLTATAMGTGETFASIATTHAQGKSAAAGKMRDFLHTLTLIEQAATNGPTAALRAAIDLTGLREAVRAVDTKENRVDSRREDNLDELVAAASAWLTDPKNITEDGTALTDLPGLDATTAWLETASLAGAGDTDEDDTDDGTVQVMTMHAAKGKEFPHVYVVGVEEDLLPHKMALTDGGPDAISEERRLLFVAVSRAQETLQLSHCASRTTFGNPATSTPSRFLKALQGVTTSVASAAPTTRFSRPSPSRYDTSRTTWSARRARPEESAPVVVTAKTPNRPDLSALAVGATVEHAMFGRGTVTDLARTTVTVTFDGAGTRTLSIAVAPLTIIT